MRLLRGVSVCVIALGLSAQEHAPQGPPANGPVETEHTAPKDGRPKPGGEHDAAEHAEVSVWWKWANFALLLGGLGYLAATKSPAYFRGRTDEIRQGIESAAAMKRDADLKVADIERRLGNLDAEIAVLKSQSMQELESERARQRVETEQMLVKVQAQSEAEIASALKSAQADLKAYSAGLALSLAEERLRQGVSPEVQNSLVRRFVQGMDNGNGTGKDAH